MFEILTLDQKNQWNNIVRSMNRYDFYHLAEYHQLDNLGQPLLLHYSFNDASFALPIVLRSIEGTHFFDITSVYGYSGPLSNRKNPEETLVKLFHKELLNFFDSRNIVSVFARLHPFLDNQIVILSDLGDVVDTNRTVAIDLSEPEQEQKRQYARSAKNQINRLKRKNVLVKEVRKREEIDSFIEIYRENMIRVNAPKMYFFPNEYFYHFMDGLPSSLFLAYYEGKAISGSLCTSCDGIVQPHLSATLNDYLRWSPLKLVWDCIRAEAVRKNDQWMHLGGGVGSADDSLFLFKAQFSDLRFIFKTWRYIHKKDIYDQLVSEKNASQTIESSFFPSYRNA